ncbi:MAG: sulfur carrier protein ThiS [Pirellula sp.]
MLTIEFNGQPRQVREGSSIADLLNESKVESRFCAVERNLEIVAKERYLQQLLQEGDKIEVVTLVGGG